MQLSSDNRDRLALHLVPGIGPRLAAALLRRFGSAAAVLRASDTELREIPHLPAVTADSIKTALASCNVDAELAFMEKHQVRLLLLGGPEYPRR
jgi:DNA processing protein